MIKEKDTEYWLTLLGVYTDAMESDGLGEIFEVAIGEKRPEEMSDAAKRLEARLCGMAAEMGIVDPAVCSGGAKPTKKPKAKSDSEEPEGEAEEEA